MSGDHPLGKLKIDWSISTSQTEGQTPYNYFMRFIDDSNAFDPNFDQNSFPNTYPDAVITDLPNSYLRAGEQQESSTSARNNTALLNFKLPITLK